MKALLAAVLVVVALSVSSAMGQATFREIPADVLEDKVRGGLLGQLLGNLNGLPHEFKYIDEPGKVETYTPGLPEGARTDDDTDIEWVYVTEMHRSRQLVLPNDEIAELWRRHINRSIWCANDYARRLMDLGFRPPLTGRIALNPWAEFNISGSFLSETFGLVAPGMPQRAGQLGLHYTHVAIEGEPAQLSQFVTAMVATAYFEDDVVKVLDAGVAALDPKSTLVGVIADVRAWHAKHPGDWRATRNLIRDKYTRHGGGMRDRNGFELNTAAAVGALLYGKGDFAETLRLAFNFGWDCDNSAATCGSILGVIKGRKWMDAQGWVVKDVYRNTTRDAMPGDETITRFGDKLVELARRAIAEGGGGATPDAGGRVIFRVHVQPARNLQPLPPATDEAFRRAMVAAAEKGLLHDDAALAKAAYIAICLGEAGRLAREKPAEWKRAVEALRKHEKLLKAVKDAAPPSGVRIQERFREAGLLPAAPAQKAEG